MESDKQRVVDRLLCTPDCEDCENAGAVITFNINKGRREIQKCDNCNRFSSDMGAWKYLKPKIG